AAGGGAHRVVGGRGSRAGNRRIRRRQGEQRTRAASGASGALREPRSVSVARGRSRREAARVGQGPERAIRRDSQGRSELSQGLRRDSQGDGRDRPHSLRRPRSEEHTSELQSHLNLVCRLLLEKKKQQTTIT